MLKQGVVQDTIADLNGPAALPPLNNLPQWSRVNTLDKARYPKPFLKDRLAPLPNPGSDKRRESLDSDDQELDDGDELQNPQIRIQHLEKSLNFLRNQHHEILGNLHDEIDNLKRENKELQFKIVMVQRNSPPGTSASKKERKSAKSLRGASGSVHGSQGSPAATAALPAAEEGEPLANVSEDKLEELKVIFLEEELKEVRKLLREEMARGQYLQQVLEAQQKQQKSAPPGVERTDAPQQQPQPATSARSSDPPPTHRQEPQEQQQEQQEGAAAAVPLPYNATLEPLLVHLPGQAARPPSLHECHVLLRHLHKANDKQAHELSQLKSDLRDVLYSHKWSPDAYLLAKAYVAADDDRERRLPRIAMKHPTRKLPAAAYSATTGPAAAGSGSAGLPALSHTVSNKATERRKRTQILQKARLRREVLH